MTGGERPVKIQLHIWSVELLLSFLETSLLVKNYKYLLSQGTATRKPESVLKDVLTAKGDICPGIINIGHKLDFTTD